MNYIDLNCDMGEMPEAIADGTQESLMPSLTSVNVACGGVVSPTSAGVIGPVIMASPATWLPPK